MAFDLNKNDGAKIAPSKFDLSKGEIEKTAGRSRAWLIGLFGILVVGGGLWYYASGKTDPAAKTSAANISSDPASVVVPAKPAKEKASGMDTIAVAAVKSPAIKEDSIRKTRQHTAPAKLPTQALKALNHAVPVTFAQGSSSFASSNKTLIKRMVAYLIKNPAASIHIDGYASSDGPIALNQQISQARADAFKNHLNSLSIEASRITATGKGIENPMASNKTASGRKKNRRVEITFL
ncbi:Outer membrane protein OmpA [Pedobacter terrae]|uniref:Outer membrane protein OmpA n=1 Tax=Pedobacter terrae TaxID=405671 RepID=A0A1G7R7N1_9SPHI|nr:OmpA family protein [Pedobacter terrae]SDG06782.1 Outer membrane protein OmpA [Pedobacter terrae]